MSEQIQSSQSGGSAAGGPRAGFWRRFVASLVDGLVIGVVNAILLGILSENAATLLAIVSGLGYYTYLEGGASGQTVGKKALGIRVVSLSDGDRIGYGRAFIRYIGRILSALPLLLGYFWMLWDGEKQTWHDKLSGSVVVPESAYPAPQWP